MRLSAWDFVPYPVRLGFLAVVVVIILALLWKLDSALEEHYTADQKRVVMEEAARANELAVKRLQQQKAAVERVLRARDARLAAMGQRIQEQDDEMERLKREKPEVAEWARQPVPDAIRARHGVR